MLSDFLDFVSRPWFWVDLFLVAIGMILLFPLMLSRRSRKRRSELLSYDGLRAVGLGVLALAWLGFFAYNRIAAAH